ncbi:MAG: exodeoxyribonuclease I, partial [Saezia sp.]
MSCLITGITPQHCLQQGLPEHEFAARIEHELATPHTIGVGYNTIRFDDEVTRFMFWRNLIDPYAREWQNGCGRWDIIDLVRTAYALRPEGIEWPCHEDGSLSLKLEDLSKANGLMHDAAHDALSDVRATIALAKLIKEKNPKLFEFCLKLRQKDPVAKELGLPTTLQSARPFLHVSGMFPATQGCLSVMWPLAMHPSNKNELLAWDLRFDPSELTQLNAQEIKLRLFTKTDALPEGVSRLPVKGVHLNRSPVVISHLKTLSEAQAKRWGIDMQTIFDHAYKAQSLPDMTAIWEDVYQRDAASEFPDVDEDLYGGFIGNDDRRRLGYARLLSPDELAVERTGFDDGRLSELLLRYRARNFPETLSQEEKLLWHEHCKNRLLNGVSASLTLSQMQDMLDELMMAREGMDDEKTEREIKILEALYDYMEELVSYIDEHDGE